MNVLHFRDGSTTSLPQDPVIDLERRIVGTPPEDRGVPFDDLKAVFFLQDEPRPDWEERRAGAFLAVEFFDGEIIRGFARYNPEQPGFFLYPAEKGRNERVFVVTGAVQSIEIENV